MLYLFDEDSVGYPTWVLTHPQNIDVQALKDEYFKEYRALEKSGPQWGPTVVDAKTRHEAYLVHEKEIKAWKEKLMTLQRSMLMVRDENGEVQQFRNINDAFIHHLINKYGFEEVPHFVHTSL